MLSFILLCSSLLHLLRILFLGLCLFLELYFQFLNKGYSNEWLCYKLFWDYIVLPFTVFSLGLISTIFIIFSLLCLNLKQYRALVHYIRIYPVAIYLIWRFNPTICYNKILSYNLKMQALGIIVTNNSLVVYFLVMSSGLFV